MTTWKTSEITYLRKNAHLGLPQLALHLGRSERSVRWKASQLGISLRRPGNRDGLLMGQPRGIPWTKMSEAVTADRLSRMREDILNGDMPVEAVLERIRETVSGVRRPLCLSCVSRPMERPQTGLCQVCHVRELARAHRDHEALTDARRELWRARQERSRANRRAAKDAE